MANNSLLITDVQIFDGREFIDKGYVLVKDGKIADVGSGSPSQADSSIKTISKPGHTLLPGLIDCHVHAENAAMNAIRQPLRFGVTTVMDMHGEARSIKILQDHVRDPDNFGIFSDYKVAGSAMTIRGGWPEPVVLAHDQSDEIKAVINSWPKLTEPSQADKCIKDQIAIGAEYIKLMHESGDTLQGSFPKPTLEIQKAAIEAAHAHGLRVVAHALSYKDTVEILECGVDGLTHSFCDAPTDERYIELYLKNGAHCNPTLAAIGSLTTEGKEMQHKYAADPLALKLLINPPGTELLCMCMAMANERAAYKNAKEAVTALYKAGVPILVGSDSAPPAVGTAFGLSTHHEMWLMHHDCSIAAIDVLRAATGMVADRFGFTDRGYIAAGRNADLLLIEGDPVEFFASKALLMPIRGVWRNGVVADTWKEVVA